jgi:hypothetical protein
MESASRLGLHHLARMGMPGDSDMRRALLRVLTELYVQKPAHTADEERHYTELALRLLDTADIGSRIAVAQRLAHYRSPPRRVVERLVGEISTTRNGEVASRPPIAIEIASELNELFFTANPEERRLILLNLGVIAPLPVKRTEPTREDSLAARLEAAVLSRNREAFAQDLAQALQISRAQARRIADDDLGEPIVTAAKALNIRRGALYRILLFVNIGRSVARVQALTVLHHELPVEAAEQMAMIWRALPKVDRATERHQPVLWEGKSTTGAPRGSAIINRPLLAAPQRRDAS